MIASCEHCGAALRLQPGARSACCVYCGVTSTVDFQLGRAKVPRLRIDPAPIVEYVDADDLLKAYVLTPVGPVVFLVGIYYTFTEGAGALIACAGGAAMTIAGIVCLHTVLQAKRRERERQWLRDFGVAGRATVEQVLAGATREATLGLWIELPGRPAYHVYYATTVPELLVPRLVQGLRVPIIVHPNDQSQIELQWHLL